MRFPLRGCAALILLLLGGPLLAQQPTPARRSSQAATLPESRAAQGVQGIIASEKVPVTMDGLLVHQPARRPAAGVTVEVVDGATGTVLAEAITDEQGAYRVLLQAPGTAYVRALAGSENARVVDVDSGAQYAVRSPSLTVEAGAMKQQDVLAADANRASGPFSILATLRRANTLLRSVAPAIQLPPVTVRAADLDLYLFDRNGRPLGASHKSSRIGGRERIRAKLGRGLYLLEVRSYRDGYNSGRFRLRLR